MDYEICLITTMTHLAGFACVFPEGERLAFIVDERAKGNGAGDLEKVRTAMRRIHRDSLRGRIGPAGYDSSAEVAGLQAADLLAHECLLQRINELDGRENRREFERLSPQILAHRSFHGSKDGDEHQLIHLTGLFSDHAPS